LLEYLEVPLLTMAVTFSAWRFSLTAFGSISAKAAQWK